MRSTPNLACHGGGSAEVTEGWSHQRIVFEVRERGTTLAALGLSKGYARNTLHCALYKPHPSAHAVIADFLGVSRHEIWPQWYGPDGKRLLINPARRQEGRSLRPVSPQPA